MFRSLWRIYSSVTLGQLLDELLNKISHALALLHISSIFYIFCCEYCSSLDVYIHDSQILHLTAWGNGGILPGFVLSRIHAAGPRLQIFSHSYSCCFLMAVSYPRINFCGAAARGHSLSPKEPGGLVRTRIFAPVMKSLKQVLLCLVGKVGGAKAKRESDSRLFPSIWHFLNSLYLF